MKRINIYTAGLALILTGSLLGVALVTLLFATVPRIEAVIFPVVENLEINDIKATDIGIELYGEFDKLRSCSLESFTVYMLNENSDISSIPIYRPNISGLTSGDFPNTRPGGHNFFGPWIIVKDDIPKDNPFSIYILYKHNCTHLWDTISTFGPYEIKY